MRRLHASAIIAVLLVVCAGGCAFAQAVQDIELHGYMLNRFYANPDSTARFAMERVSLSAVGKLGQDGTAYIEVYYHPWLTDRVLGTAPNQFTAEQGRVYMESAYVDLPWAGGRIRIGKGRHLAFGMTPSYPNRKTTQYGILSETFTQDRIQGFQYVYKKDALDFAASLTTDLRIGSRSAGEFPGVESSKVVRHFCERDDNANLSGRLAGSVKLGVSKPNVQAHISGAVGKLVQADADFIGGQYGFSAGANTNRDHNKWGADVIYNWGPYVAQSEWYQGNFSFLKVTGYNVLVGYQPKEGRKAYLRWAALNNDRPTNPERPLTWDIQQFTVGIVQPIRKGVWAEFQYEKNKEKGGSVDNDLLFVEFFTGF